MVRVRPGPHNKKQNRNKKGCCLKYTCYIQYVLYTSKLLLSTNQVSEDDDITLDPVLGDLAMVIKNHSGDWGVAIIKREQTFFGQMGMIHICMIL